MVEDFKLDLDYETQTSRMKRNFFKYRFPLVLIGIFFCLLVYINYSQEIKITLNGVANSTTQQELDSKVTALNQEILDRKDKVITDSVLILGIIIAVMLYGARSSKHETWEHWELALYLIKELTALPNKYAEFIEGGFGEGTFQRGIGFDKVRNPGNPTEFLHALIGFQHTGLNGGKKNYVAKMEVYRDKGMQIMGLDGPLKKPYEGNIETIVYKKIYLSEAEKLAKLEDREGEVTYGS